MAETIANYLQDRPLQLMMQKAIRHKMDVELIPENMAKGFTDAVQYVLK